MTIHYQNRTVLEALMMSRSHDTLSVAIRGEVDTRSFALIGGTWISEEGEPVRIEFTWERHEQATVPTEADCVCSKKLASRLIAKMLVGSDGEELMDDMLWVLSAESQRVSIHRERLAYRA